VQTSALPWVGQLERCDLALPPPCWRTLPLDHRWAWALRPENGAPGPCFCRLRPRNTAGAGLLVVGR